MTIKRKFKILGYRDTLDNAVIGFVIQNSMADAAKAAEDAGITVRKCIDLGHVSDDAEHEFRCWNVPETEAADLESGDITQMDDFDTYLALLVRYNPQVHPDDICDVLTCSNCPYNGLTGSSDSVDECQSALLKRLSLFRGDCYE